MARKKNDPGAGRSAPHLVALDTSCIIALVSDWHEHHGVTISALDERLDAGHGLALLAPALVEAYAVLTRLPAPRRLAPSDALQLLITNFQENAQTVALSADEYWSLVASVSAAGVYGGRTYDAAIAACARKAKARELLTLNLRHFDVFADAHLLVSSPLGRTSGW